MGSFAGHVIRRILGSKKCLPPTNHKKRLKSASIRMKFMTAVPLTTISIASTMFMPWHCHKALWYPAEAWTTKVVPFKRRKVMGRRKDRGEARGRQERGSLLQIYNAKWEIRSTLSFLWLSIRKESSRVMCDLPQVPGAISSRGDPELLKSHCCPVTAVALSKRLIPGLIQESLPADRAAEKGNH